MAEPKVRFKRSDGSDYAEWEEKHLRDVASRVTRKNKNNETDIPLTIASIEGLVDQRTYFGKKIASKDMSGYYLLNKGEFAYNKSYSNGYDYGSIKRLDNYDNGALSTLYICFALNENENSDFYNCYFNGLSWYSQMREICAEGARNHGLLNVSANDFFDISLSVPSDFEEQQRISDFFDEVDNLISSSEKEIEKLQKFKKGCLQKMFPREGADVPEVRFPGFTDAWEQRKLSDICERVTRKNKSNESNLPLTIASQYGLIDQRDFFNRVVAAKDMSNYYLLKKGEFAYNKSYSNGYDYGSIKRLDAYEQGCLSTLYICFGLVSDEVDSDYLQCYFDTLQWYGDVSQICAEGARNHGLLNVDTKAFFDDVYVRMPVDIKEQKKISDFLNNLDNLITLHQRECEKYKELKKGLLQKMFV